MNQKCCGLTGLIFGHDFRAQYDERSEPVAGIFPAERVLPSSIEGEPRVLLEAQRTALMWMPDLIQAATKHESVYRGAVCRRCGDTRSA